VYQVNPKASGKEIAALADFFRTFLQIDPNDPSRGNLSKDLPASLAFWCQVARRVLSIVEPSIL